LFVCSLFVCLFVTLRSFTRLFTFTLFATLLRYVVVVVDYVRLRYDVVRSVTLFRWLITRCYVCLLLTCVYVCLTFTFVRLFALGCRCSFVVWPLVTFVVAVVVDLRLPVCLVTLFYVIYSGCSPLRCDLRSRLIVYVCSFVRLRLRWLFSVWFRYVSRSVRSLPRCYVCFTFVYVYVRSFPLPFVVRLYVCSVYIRSARLFVHVYVTPRLPLLHVYVVRCCCGSFTAAVLVNVGSTFCVRSARWFVRWVVAVWTLRLGRSFTAAFAPFTLYYVPRLFVCCCYVCYVALLRLVTLLRLLFVCLRCCLRCCRCYRYVDLRLRCSLRCFTFICVPGCPGCLLLRFVVVLVTFPVVCSRCYVCYVYVRYVWRCLRYVYVVCCYVTFPICPALLRLRSFTLLVTFPLPFTLRYVTLLFTFVGTLLFVATLRCPFPLFVCCYVAFTLPRLRLRLRYVGFAVYVTLRWLRCCLRWRWLLLFVSLSFALFICSPRCLLIYVRLLFDVVAVALFVVCCWLPRLFTLRYVV